MLSGRESGIRGRGTLPLSKSNRRRAGRRSRGWRKSLSPHVQHQQLVDGAVGQALPLVQAVQVRIGFLQGRGAIVAVPVPNGQIQRSAGVGQGLQGRRPIGCWSAGRRPLSPIPELAEAQKRITVLPVKSLARTKLSTGQSFHTKKLLSCISCYS